MLALATLAACGDDDGTPGTDAGPPDAPMGDAGPTCTITAAEIGATGAPSRPPDGIGGAGDLAVETDVLRAVFARVDREALLGASGGTIIDLHLVTSESDHMNELSQLAGVSQDLRVRYTEMNVVTEDDRHVVIEVRGHLLPGAKEPGETPAVTPDPGENIRVTTQYELRCGEPIVHMTTTIENTADVTYRTDIAFAAMDVMMWGGSSKGLLPFCPVRGQGTDCIEFSFSNPLASVVEGPYFGSSGSRTGDPGSYAFFTEHPEQEILIGVHSTQVSSFGFFAFGENQLMPGQQIVGRRAVAVGGDADAASSIDVALEALEAAGRIELSTVTGIVAPPAGETFSPDPYQRPLVLLAEPPIGGGTDPAQWTPLTMVRVDETGAFTARVPAGDIAWELRALAREPKRGMGGTAQAGATLTLEGLSVDPLPELRIEVRDITSGTASSLPARVVIEGTGTTQDPVLGSAWGASPGLNVALTDGEGDVVLRLPAGTYEVWATHGPFWTVASQAVTVDATTGGDAHLELRRLDVIPAGFVTADFHVHSAASFDSSLPIDDRVRAFIADGVDAIVSTEHDVIFDYGPALAAVEATLPPAWRGKLRTYVGVETTSWVPSEEFPHTIGHHNAFPLDLVEGAHKNGAPDDEFMAVGELYDLLRSIPGEATRIVQLNHGRADTAGALWLGYFDSCGFDPTMPVDPMHRCFANMGPMGSRPWDFDAMEVANGKNSTGFVHMVRDWYALLRHAPGGRLPVGTANSDSHNFVYEEAGWPVTVLRTDTPLAMLDDAALVSALTSGAASGALGVFVWASAIEEGGTTRVEPGRMPLAAPSGRVLLDVRVAAAPWIPVDEVRIRVGGEIVRRLTGADLTTPADPFGTGGVVRYEGTIDLTGMPLTADSFITVEAGFVLPRAADLDGDGRLDATDNDGDGDVDMMDLAGGIDLGPLPTGPMAVIASEAHPVGFTNPIFVDVNGNGAYDPPGTPVAE